MNSTLSAAYRTKERSCNDLLDFDDGIGEDDVEFIAEYMRTHNVKEFTISCCFARLFKRLEDFDRLGFKVNGIVTVNTRYKDRVPALLLRDVKVTDEPVKATV